MDIRTRFQVNSLTNLARTLQSFKSKPLKNTSEIRQSCVALIFRFNPVLLPHFPIASTYFTPNYSFLIDHSTFSMILDNFFFKLPSSLELPESAFEILFIQRAFNKNDRHSGQIAFPGGKCDGGETDIEAVCREVMEEVGIDIKNPENLIKFLGKSEKNFIHLPNLSCSLAIFFDFKGNQILKNPSEVQNYQWVPALLFFNPPKRIISLRKFKLPHLILLYSHWLPQNIKKRVGMDYESSSLPVFDIGMNVPLWGFTLEMMHYIIDISLHNIESGCEEEIQKYCKVEEIDKNLKFALESIQILKTNFRKEAKNKHVLFGKIFDLEWKLLIWRIFGYKFQEEHQNVEKTMNYGLNAFLSFLLISNFFSSL